jgi:hypothetical protein
MAMGELPAGYVMYLGNMVSYSDYLAMTNKPVGNPDQAMLATLTPAQSQQQYAATQYGYAPAVTPSSTPAEVQAAYDLVEQGKATSPPPTPLELNAEPYVARNFNTPVYDPFSGTTGSGNDIVITRAVTQTGDNAGESVAASRGGKADIAGIVAVDGLLGRRDESA